MSSLVGFAAVATLITSSLDRLTNSFCRIEYGIHRVIPLEMSRYVRSLRPGYARHMSSPYRCPECEASAILDLESQTSTCAACGHEWNPRGTLILMNTTDGEEADARPIFEAIKEALHKPSLDGD